MPEPKYGVHIEQAFVCIYMPSSKCVELEVLVLLDVCLYAGRATRTRENGGWARHDGWLMMRLRGGTTWRNYVADGDVQ